MSEYNCIMIIDDDEITRFVTQSAIERLNLGTVCQFQGAKEAIDYVNAYAASNDSHCPELIFVDINLPDISGFEFTNMLQGIPFKNKDQIKVIVLSNSLNHRDREKLDKMNLPFIEKPLNKEKLSNVLFKNSPQVSG